MWATLAVFEYHFTGQPIKNITNRTCSKEPYPNSSPDCESGVIDLLLPGFYSLTSGARPYWLPFCCEKTSLPGEQCPS